MNLEEIQEALISDFDVERTLDILNKIDDGYTKENIIENANGLIKMAYLSREMDDVNFSAGHIVVSRSYYEEEEVIYSLDFALDIHSSIAIELEKPFTDENTTNNEDTLKQQLEDLLELNKNEFDKNEDNHFLKTNIIKLQNIIENLN